MVKKGDTWKDLIIYLKYRKFHLGLELQKVPFTVKRSQRGNAIRKLKGRINEIEQTIRVVNSDIRKCSKYEFSKAKWLKKQKIEHLKGGEIE